jgi:RecJ-like exonuclease
LNSVVVIHHYDADGVSAGAIAIKALKRLGKNVSSICLKQLYREDVEKIRALGNFFIFVDFGSGQTDYLGKEFGFENMIVLDHHQPKSFERETYHINPLLFGINGAIEISGAGVAYFFALGLDKNNFDLAPLAIVGAVGDMEDFTGELVGLNKIILSHAVKNNLMLVKNDLRLFGRISRPLVSFITYSSSPVIPGLTAMEENVKSFLMENKIPLKEDEKWLAYEDLREEEKKRLRSALVTHMCSYNMTENKINSLFGETYTLLNENSKSPLRDAKEFSTMLNACGRHARPEVALAVCLGDREELYSQALWLMQEHRAELAKGINFVTKKGVDERSSFYFFDSEDQIQDSLVGIIAGMLYGSIISETKPIIALARHADGTVKASSRGTYDLVKKGLNLGKAIHNACEGIEGAEGGGHRVAAGAKIPSEKIDLFLEKLEKEIAEQMKIGVETHGI